MDKIKKLFKKLFKGLIVVVILLVYIGLVVAGNIIIWKIAKHYFINPLRCSITFTIGSIYVAILGFIYYCIKSN